MPQEKIPCDLLEIVRDKVGIECEQHLGQFECPDSLIYHNPDPSEERYGLIFHDGGSSYIAIRHCPWCGTSVSGMDEKDEPTE